jgi:cellulose synthase/poly-beta-1,6-N-acetylglucosamine synthase-like glycosyltransferase
MLVTRAAYRSVGGYENIPFSITEDYALFRDVVKQGWGFGHTDKEGAVAWTKAMPNWKALLRQRKRWLHGALQTQWYFRLLFYFNVLVLPLFFGLLVFDWRLAVGFWVVRAVPSFLIIPRLMKMGLKDLIAWIPLTDLYIPAVQLAMLVSYYLPGKISWKGREYDRRNVG